MSVKSRQQGLATIEFALGGALALTVLVGSIEISRALYVWNSVGESARRAAHMAAICPMNDPAIAQAAMLSGTTKSTVLHGFSPGMITVTYLDDTGASTTVLNDVEYVTVSISGYYHTIAIPFAGATLLVPPFRTTLPAESLGYLPDTDSYGCLGT